MTHPQNLSFAGLAEKGLTTHSRGGRNQSCSNVKLVSPKSKCTFHNFTDKYVQYHWCTSDLDYCTTLKEVNSNHVSGSYHAYLAQFPYDNLECLGESSELFLQQVQTIYITIIQTRNTMA